MPKLSDNLQKEFNKQIQEELGSALMYYAAAAWFSEQSLTGFATWLKVQAAEEFTHAHRFFRHTVDRMGHVEIYDQKPQRTDWKSALEAFEEAYKQEVHITGRIHSLIEMAKKEPDNESIYGILEWFAREQVEEESQVADIVQKLKMIGDNMSGLLLMDQQLGARVFVWPVDLVL